MKLKDKHEIRIVVNDSSDRFVTSMHQVEIPSHSLRLVCSCGWHGRLWAIPSSYYPNRTIADSIETNLERVRHLLEEIDVPT